MKNDVSGYAPQIDWEMEEKEKFWSEFDGVVESIPMVESGEWSRLQWACC